MPEEVRRHFRENVGARGKSLREAWEAKFARYKEEYPAEAGQLEMIFRGELPKDWDAEITPFPADAKGIASRASSGKVLTEVAKRVPWLLGGSADLAPSTLTLLKFRAPAISSPATAPDATSISASASMSWARSSTAWP